MIVSKIPGYDDYLATQCGKVLSLKNRRVTQMKPYGDKDGYPSVKLWRKGERLTEKVHKVVLESFVGPRPDGMECRHLDGDNTNNALGNLAWGTHDENYQDRLRHGTGQEGEKNPVAKLTNAQAEEMRKLRAAGWKLARLAGRFGVSIPTCSLLCRGKVY